MNFRKLGEKLWSRRENGRDVGDHDHRMMPRKAKEPRLPETYQEWLTFEPQVDNRPFLVRLLCSIRPRIAPSVSSAGGKTRVKVEEVGISGGTDF